MPGFVWQPFSHHIVPAKFPHKARYIFSVILQIIPSNDFLQHPLLFLPQITSFCIKTRFSDADRDCEIGDFAVISKFFMAIMYVFSKSWPLVEVIVLVRKSFNLHPYSSSTLDLRNWAEVCNLMPG